MNILNTLKSYITTGSIQFIGLGAIILGIFLLDVDIAYRLLAFGVLVFALTFIIEV